MDGQSHEVKEFPWELGIYDAHCHPTDTMASISDIPNMKAAALTVMSTRGEDQELVAKVAKNLGEYSCYSGNDNSNGKIVPCFGWHPWFAHQIQIQENSSAETNSDSIKAQHYRNVLFGTLGNEEEDSRFFKTLPAPKPLSVLLDETKARLLARPNALVGEVGLDKAFRLPMPWQEEELESRNTGLTPGSREGRRLSPYKVTLEHQKALLKAQLQLAGQLRRAVSVHSVQAHGAVLEVFQELWKGHERKMESKRRRKKQQRVEEEADQVDAIQDGNNDCENMEKTLPYPPRICMHSYSGSPEAIKQLTRPEIPSEVYFSFSTVINFDGPSSKWARSSLKSLPDDRILVESDLHTAGQKMDDLLEDVIKTVCRVKGWPLEGGIRKLADNWQRFVFG